MTTSEYRQGWQTNHGTRKHCCPDCVKAGKAPKKRPKVTK